MSQKKLSEYIDALDGITYPQWVKLRSPIRMELVLAFTASAKISFGRMRSTSSSRPALVSFSFSIL